ncbi:MAG: hypothetical protein LUQ29_13895 [Methylococcaceae bacterium]|jgi:hypothetical protein|nr:hypothetical protein [Methylococcaceae bacterium]
MPINVARINESIFYWLDGDWKSSRVVSRVGRATVLSLPDISGFDKETAVGKPIVISIFNHRNVGHKQYARPTKL